ncbi:UDP-N-acetylmuramate dehydrogenase [Lachnoclostridium sp. Marseille-P6806]|uniref:UDP-N-acetylmuramate dehydrogenase n=1 Tax=Lachnoclostridium sp. Marseille-P6806 TaxID=2364793 RepID=UPI0013EF20C5|nr:UDP-N-acetylmuramate dehydrogenase [Lachnoclostridium sp. Marseille-P6806]
MNNTELTDALRDFLADGQILAGESMSAHSSFRTGGPAELFIQVYTAAELRRTLALLAGAGMPVFLLGRGTNILVGDGGFRGAVVSVASRSPYSLTDTVDEQRLPAAAARGTQGASSGGDGELLLPLPAELPRLDAIRVCGRRICCGAGASLAGVSAAARDHGLAGLEFAAGIPGSVGGALVMNAGAYGGEMKRVVESADMLCPDGRVQTCSCEEMEFGYRRSILRGSGAAALGAVFALTEDEPERIRERMEELAEKRRARQPLEFGSAGSTFKRPEGHFAGQLIEEAGLRGFRIGDAQVSEKHCGFVINRGRATAAELRAVIEAVQKRVMENSGISLEREVILLGEF